MKLLYDAMWFGVQTLDVWIPGRVLVWLVNAVMTSWGYDVRVYAVASPWLISCSLMWAVQDLSYSKLKFRESTCLETRDSSFLFVVYLSVLSIVQ